MPACIACIAIIDSTMSVLHIRGIDDALKRKLRVRAAENGHSMEEEVRQILRHTLGVPSPEEEDYRQLEELATRSRGR